MDVYSAVLPSRGRRRLQGEVRDLFRTTTKVRDLEAMHSLAASVAAEAPRSLTAGVDAICSALEGDLVHEAESARKEIEAFVHRDVVSHLVWFVVGATGIGPREL